uniref:GPN-loop GTPase n=1 Tax=Steinernema glaseri TaxID=37863 RepID=A0A1I8A951_9BILA
MSNMLYACSILYRTKLPFFLVLNKADIVKPTFAIRWMTDFEAFEEALNEAKSSYMNDLTRSMSLVLDQFYEKLNYACVSSLTGEGMEDVMAVVEKCVEEYREEYRPMYEKVLKERQEETLNKMGELTVKEKVACEVGFDENYVAPTQKVHLGGIDEEDRE